MKTIRYLRHKKKFSLIKMIIIFIILFVAFLLITDYNDGNDDIFSHQLHYTERMRTLSSPNHVDEVKTVQKIKAIAAKDMMPPLIKKKLRRQVKRQFNTDMLEVPSERLDDIGPGEDGRPVIMPQNMSAELKKLVDEGWKNNAFNQYASDLISLRRSVPDARDPWCKEPGRYLTDLPATSVVIIFHNEAWSTLLRTVHSVLDRSPEKLLKEVILVDDFSDLPHLKEELEEYLKDYPKVRVVRHEKREGLIRARLNGLKHVTAPVVTYLDSHCECTEGWLEPLLDRIARDPTTVVCPTIDTIDDATFQYHWHSSKVTHVGGFGWKLHFRWHPLPAREVQRRSNSAEPARSPTMAGGLFAIDKAFFEKLGTYDDGFDIWGGENLEISFKTWMCGGTLEILPCSHVGHIFRKRSPYKWRQGVNVVLKNSVRLAEVWLDEYAKYFYQEVEYNATELDIGDISSRKALRNSLGCKSFRWYLQNVYPELNIPGPILARGEVRNLGAEIVNNKPRYWCLDSDAGKETHMKPVKMYQCHGLGQNQFWVYTSEKEIRKEEVCLDGHKGNVFLYNCHKLGGNQIWNYIKESQMIRQGKGHNCLAMDLQHNVTLEKCDENNILHKWEIQNFNASVTFKN